MKIGILGYGNIGKGVCEIIEKQFDDIQIAHICVKDETDCLDNRFTTDPDVLLENIDVLLEMIVGEEPAHTIICRALKSHIHVVTSNKATVAAYLGEYISLAKTNKVQLRYEASVGGGIPWIQSLIKAKRVDSITSCKGILNGTTNYILDRMYKDNLSFTECLKIAQELGYAEANPSADIDGYDIQRKIMITSALAYEGINEAEEFDRLSLANIQFEEIEYFKNKGCMIKYIGQSVLNGTLLYGSVEPVLLSKDHVFSTVDKNNNVVELQGKTIGTLTLIGQGAGRYPTANAMIQDLLDIKEGRNDSLQFNKHIEMDKNWLSYVYVFCSTVNVFANQQFDHVVNYKGRYIATTKPITPEERNSLLRDFNENNQTMFCMRKEAYI